MRHHVQNQDVNLCIKVTKELDETQCEDDEEDIILDFLSEADDWWSNDGRKTSRWSTDRHCRPTGNISNVNNNY